MYPIIAIGLMVVLPLISIATELVLSPGADLLLLIGKWFTFWGIGIRLLTAAASQTMRPAFTAKDIFAIEDPKAADIVRELGFANLAFGLIGILSLPFPGFLPPAAVAGGLFLALDGLLHITRPHRNPNETIAMITDLAVAAAVVVYLIGVVT